MRARLVHAGRTMNCLPLSRGVTTISDPHVHFWSPETHAWLKDVLPGGPAADTPYGRFAPVARKYHPEEHVASLAPFAGVSKTVYVQSNMHVTTGDPVAETAYMQGLADATAHPTGIVAWAPLDKPAEAAAVLDRHMKFANFRGVRFMLDWHPTRPELNQSEHGHYMTDRNFLKGVALLQERGLSFDLQICAVQAAEAAKFASKFPKLQFILNHAMFPLKGEFDSWKEGLRRLAALPNVACKISGLGAYDQGFDLAEARPHVLACLELFGVDRCMFASNLPVDLVDWPMGPPAKRWSTYLTIVTEAGFDSTAVQKLFHDNAAKFYRI